MQVRLSRVSTLLALVLVFPGERVQATPVADTIKYVLSGEGNEARYRAREQLAGLDLPNDAVGKTNKISGQIVVDDKGKVIRELSKIEVDVSTLVSDQERRDNFIRRNTLQTTQYPTVTFVPTELKGLRFPLANSGDVTFQMVGEMTVRNVTKPVTWDVTAKLEAGAIAGTAITKFTFDQFEMTKPRVARVLSLDDEVKLEYDFRLVREKK